MSPFKRLRDRLGLDDGAGTSQNLHWISLFLLALGDDDELNPASITYSDDDAKEVLLRLRTRGYRGFAMQEMERLLSPRVK
jgi:hypothetical protein